MVYDGFYVTFLGRSTSNNLNVNLLMAPDIHVHE